jgi:hypothetical protein
MIYLWGERHNVTSAFLMPQYLDSIFDFTQLQMGAT